MSEVKVKVTYLKYCQACSKDFRIGDGAYYVPMDNNIVCEDCSEVHKVRELRVVQN